MTATLWGPHRGFLSLALRACMGVEVIQAQPVPIQARSASKGIRVAYPPSTDQE